MRAAYGEYSPVFQHSGAVLYLHDVDKIYDISSVDEYELFRIKLVKNCLQAFADL